VREKRRKRASSVSKFGEMKSTATVCLRYNSMLYMDFIDGDEMVIAEEPWLNIVATFPAAMARRVYGT
jgi:hypothetical protein